MPSPVSAVKPTTAPARDGQASPLRLFRGRESEELIVAFSGPLGCGIGAVVDAAAAALGQAGYQVTTIKLSDYIESALSSRIVSAGQPSGASEAARRYNRLQDGGNALRARFSENGILAEWAVTQIAIARTADIRDKKRPGAIEDHVPLRRAFIIDQLKHPQEVSLLRMVYRNLFFLIGVLSVEDRRRERLHDKGMSEPDIAQTMDRDRNEPAEHGQHLDKTLEMADFFIRNDKPNINLLRDQLSRFVDLMHGANGVSPTSDEFGMYVAYAASLASACLSRQVGAAVLDARRNVLGTGCNDVPRPGGGLYTAEAGTDDARCVKQEHQRCWNDHYKSKLRGEIAAVLHDTGRVDNTSAEALASAICERSRIKDLIEFSRAVHAEMEAIISVARRGVAGLQDATLYTTTFPCHSCARHIVAAGLARVIYIEPYERSLALELHGDSLTLEPSPAGVPRPSGARVELVHFEGVAPRRYVSMFLPPGERKHNGVALKHPLADSRKAVPEFLDSYRDFEAKVVKHWQEIESQAGGSRVGA